MMRQRGNHRAGSVNLVSQCSHEIRVFGDVNVHAGAEADETEPLTPCQAVSLVDIAQNSPRDQSCDLHAGHVRAADRTQPQRVALVLQGSLIESGVDEAPGMVPALLHTAVHGRAVGMYVEDIHKHADLDGLTLEVG